MKLLNFYILKINMFKILTVCVPTPKTPHKTYFQFLVKKSKNSNCGRNGFCSGQPNYKSKLNQLKTAKLC